MPGPFHGLKVVDLTTVVVGPYCTQMLSDLGAEVTKVEAPEGDMTRMNRPKRNDGMSHTFLQLNRNKKSIALDLKNPDACEVLQRLISEADVFVHNMRPEPLARLGFDYAKVREMNPGIVYCNIWGFGREGRYAGRAAFDDVIQGASGLVALEGFNGREMRYVPMLIADKLTGVMAALAISAALYHKLATGEGQEVEVPMFESMTSFAMIEHLSGETFVPSLGKPGSERHATPMRWPYQTSDGFICVLPSSDKHWRAVLSIGGRDDLIDDPRFRSRASRLAHRAEVMAAVEELMVNRPTKEWVDALAEAGVPCMQINSLDEVVMDPHLADVGFWYETDHPTEGRVRLMRPPYTLSKSPAEIRTMPPRFGEHTAAVLAELGYSDDQISAMLEAGAAMAASPR
jgi:crotonobetainyl-CoA:carnitine CoA-transferase CaiB-like acyl-CoA transferase